MDWFQRHLKDIYEPGYRRRLLAPLRILYQQVVSYRYLRAKKTLRQIDPDLGIPVVVIGNLTLGGTGKTPVVIALVEALRGRGFKPAVVSRGYGAKWKKGDLPRVVNIDSIAGDVGDEPKLIFMRAMCPVVVCPDRKKAALKIKAIFPDCDVIVTDDGLQHYGLKRQVEVVVMDEVRGLGNGLCLPEGPLREPILRLKTVDIVLSQGASSVAIDRVYSVLNPMLSYSFNEFTKKVVGKRVHAIAGIGYPEKFFELLKRHGLNCLIHSFPDHHNYQLSDFSFFQPEEILVMTQKDEVKCSLIFKPSEGYENRIWCVSISASLALDVIEKIVSLLTKK